MESKNELILISGTAGFIGFHLAHSLLKKGFEVIGIDNFNNYYSTRLKEKRHSILKKFANFAEKRIDLEDKKSLNRIFTENKISLVCNLAAQAGVRYSLTHPHVYQKSNLEAFLNILEAVRKHGVKRLVYASSSSVYGGNKKVPFSEKDPVDHPISLYAATKKSNELMAHCYSHLYDIQTVGLRFFTVYGPWGRPDMAMWLFAEAIKYGKPIKVFNYGNMKRDFTYIDDIIQGVRASLFNDDLEKYEIFNLGNHKSEELMYMIELIEKEMGKKAEKEMLPIQPGDVPESFADIDKAAAKLNFKPHTSIDKGIPAFVKWYKKHNDIAEAAYRNKNNT